MVTKRYEDIECIIRNTQRELKGCNEDDEFFLLEFNIALDKAVDEQAKNRRVNVSTIISNCTRGIDLTYQGFKDEVLRYVCSGNNEKFKQYLKRTVKITHYAYDETIKFIDSNL